MRPRRRSLALACLLLLASGCVHILWRTDPKPLSTSQELSRTVQTPLKVHLTSGATVLFRQGAHLTRERIVGQGRFYALMSDSSVARDTIPMDSVAALETFDGKKLGAPSTVLSLAATALGGAATIVILKAIFGSCPTVYADTGSGPVLEAEGFSYAIAPLFEHRDVDRLRARPDSDGIVRLELRNEALETHFINQIELAAVHHARGTRILPDQASKLTAVSGVRALAAATDRAGRDVRAALASSDGVLYSTADDVAAQARVGDLNDWIDIEADDVPPGDSVAVVLRLRNSLLNTVLLYDEMLGGPDAIQWLGNELQHISTAVDLSRWYTRTMGLHVGAPGARTVRLNDVGPLAFRDVAIVLPRPTATADGRIRVRLRFVADNWRIDYAAIAGVVARPRTTAIPVARVVVPTPARGGPATLDTAAVHALADVDNKYLETHPGQRMTLEFSPPATRSVGETTYLIAWQGWYREWIRREWVTEPLRPTAFAPGDSALLSAMQRWRARKVEFERAFYSSRVPVR